MPKFDVTLYGTTKTVRYYTAHVEVEAADEGAAEAAALEIVDLSDWEEDGDDGRGEPAPVGDITCAEVEELTEDDDE